VAKIEIELPDSRSGDAGLLTPDSLDCLLSIADRVAESGSEPMSMDEINAEVKAARIERRQCAGGH